MNKFELLDKKEEIINKLVKIHQEYKKEYSKYLNSTFVLAPICSQKNITLDDYNIDKNTLTVSFTHERIFFITRNSSQYVNRFRNIPSGNYSLYLPLNDAKSIFSKNDKLNTKLLVFVKPKKKPRDSYDGYFDIKYIVLKIYSSNGDKLLSFVFHQFEEKKNKKGRLEGFTWKTDMIKY